MCAVEPCPGRSEQEQAAGLLQPSCRLTQRLWLTEPALSSGTLLLRSEISNESTLQSRVTTDGRHFPTAEMRGSMAWMRV